MANEEQLSILKQGVEVWNEWREENRNQEIDLSGTNLSKTDFYRANLELANLSGANFSSANLEEANLSGSKLIRATLTGADLTHVNFLAADLSEAHLAEADLSAANLSFSNLSRADFRESYLFGASLGNVNLSAANLSGADLVAARFLRANLKGCRFLHAKMGGTIFANSNLNEANDLDNVIHDSPSNIVTNTFAVSKGTIPTIFLRGCGLSDWEIEQAKLYNPALSKDEFIDIQNRIFDLRNGQAIQISPLFISYSHTDGQFADKLEGQLNKKGVRFWRDIHDAKAGRLEKQIDRAISQNRTVLLILSEHSLKSDWVEHEVRTARELEKEIERDVLCPVALDDSWKSSRWPKRLMEQIMEYNILDFSAWEDDVKFEGMFRKLIDGLELFYKG